MVPRCDALPLSYPFWFSEEHLERSGMMVLVEFNQASLPEVPFPKKYRPASHRPRPQLWLPPWMWWAWLSAAPCWCSSYWPWPSVRPSVNCRYTQETSMLSLCSSSWGEAESVRGLLPQGLSWSDSDRSA